tara:strand:+ start:447 stop:758 length:312 start_codon:yes stop_codon:yes gene_type:complete
MGDYSPTKKKRGRKKSLKKKKLSSKKYKSLIKRKQKKKSLSKKDNEKLEDELYRKFCSCVKTIKYNKKTPKNSEYSICLYSIYKQRKLKIPDNAVKNCKKIFK